MQTHRLSKSENLLTISNLFGMNPKAMEFNVNIIREKLQTLFYIGRGLIMGWFFAYLGGLLAFAGLIDWRRRRNNNKGERPINPNAKDGESSNYIMGDNHYTGGDH